MENSKISTKTCIVLSTIYLKKSGVQILELQFIIFQPGHKTESHWECQTCMSDKFPFTLVENEVIVQNSSFSRKC